jgi:Na+-driven multidrug efflux pump
MYYHSHHSHKYKSYPSYEVHEVILSLFNNNKLVLNHTFIFLILLISFMNSLGLGLVMIQLMSSPERTEWIWYYHLNF